MYSVAITGGLSITDSNVMTLNKTYSASNTTTVSEFRYNTYTVAASTTNNVISFPNITASQYIYIESDKPIDVKFNDTANTAITINKFLLTDVAATAIYITNNNALSATVKVVIAGA